ncbi:hypothetical protein G9A89_018924 [Geosiphon pyriformis]|nr:hypothetical protein G9A89_018924 [Geosiphon pyriformis]
MESDPEEYENKSNNPVTAQAKSMVNKKLRVLFPTTPSYHQTLQSRIVFNPPLETQSETSQTPRNPHSWNQHSWTKSLGEYGLLFGNLTPAASQTEGNPDYYTTAQVLNQFIKGLRSSILRSIRPRHPTSLQDAITLARDFESAKQEANHTQAVNLAINGTSDINAKIIQLSEKLTQKIEGFLAGTTETYQPPQRRENNNNSRYPQQQNYPIPTTATTTRNLNTSPVTAEGRLWTKIKKTHISNPDISKTCFVHSTTAPELLSTTTNDTSNPLLSNFPLQPIEEFQQQSGTNQQWTISTNPLRSSSYFDLIEDQSFDKSTLVERGDIKQIFQPSKQTKSNIPSATITKDTTLATIFPFDINNLNTHSLFSGAAINQNKPIMALYTDARVGGIDIKLILDSGSAGSIITKHNHTETIAFDYGY